MFFDRLNCKEDKEWFKKQLLDLRRSHLKSVKENEFKLDCLFSDIFNIEDENPSYEEITDQESLVKTLNDFQIDYNDSNVNSMNIVFFEQALKHFLRIFRILR